MYDLIIIGAGPAGITAAIYASRQKLKFLILGLDIGGQVSWSSDVENYPAEPHLTGLELTKKLEKHLEKYNVNVRQEEVVKLKKKKKKCVVKTKKREYESKAVIIASGKKPKKLNVEGENKFIGRGVSYCATCDGTFFKNKKVAVLGGGNSALESALFLSKYAKKVYLLDIKKKLKGAPYLRNKVEKKKKIKHINKAFTRKIEGKKKVNKIIYEKNGIKRELKVEGIFIEIGLVSKSDFTNVKKNKWGEIKIHRSTRTNEENMTNVEGVYAAGDVTDIPAKQIVAAAGEGCKAALASFDYIHKWDKKYEDD